MTGQPTTTRVLLAVFAHPDDETFLAGPILARYAHEGVRVELVVATAKAPADVRARSLACAAEQLGISRIHRLGYADSPLRSAQRKNVHQLAPPPLAGARAAQLVDDIARVIAAVKPQAVLVDAPYGSYGHPDHVVVHQAAVSAFRASAPADSRLYTLAFPMPLVRLNLRLLRLRGVPVWAMGPDGGIDLRQIVRSSSGKTGLVPVARYVRFRRAAASCYEHEIRAAPLPLRLLERSPLWLQRLIFSRQAITRIAPRPDRFERDLFE